MLDKIAASLPPSPTSSQADPRAIDYPSTNSLAVCAELVQLFQHVASNKQKDLQLDLPAEFVHNLVAAKKLVEAQRPQDVEILLQHVHRMIAVLKVRGNRHWVPCVEILNSFGLENNLQNTRKLKHWALYTLNGHRKIENLSLDLDLWLRRPSGTARSI